MEHARRTAVETITAVCAAIAAVFDPTAGIVAAGAVPAVNSVVLAGFERLDAKAEARSALVVVGAAQFSGRSPEAIVRACEGDSGLEELLRRVRTAARNTTALEKLVAYAAALSDCVEDPDVDVSLVTELVEVLDALRLDHFELLARFTWPRERVFGRVGDDDRWNETPVETLNRIQVEQNLAPELANLDSLLAGLRRYGLVEPNYMGTSDFGGSGPAQWAITSYGWNLHQTLSELATLLEARVDE
jgi:hypothetical protein